MNGLNRIIVDSTGMRSEMCEVGARFGTDKSPHTAIGGANPYRHSYTPFYDLIFSNRRYDEVTLGELGVLNNSSMHMWRTYFPRAKLFGFDYDMSLIQRARSDCLPRTHYDVADVTNPTSLFSTLDNTGCMFDILIDDSTHQFDHQISFARVGINFVKPGGLIIIEDIFCGWDETRYEEALAPLFPYLSSGVFVETRHENSFTGDHQIAPYYNNDKLLVLFRNELNIGAKSF